MSIFGTCKTHFVYVLQTFHLFSSVWLIPGAMESYHYHHSRDPKENGVFKVCTPSFQVFRPLLSLVSVFVGVVFRRQRSVS